MAKQPTQWTLVQHSGHQHHPGFHHAVEEAAVTRAGLADKIRKAGGLLFDSYREASLAEYQENFPPNVTGLYPHVRGTFVNLQVDHRKLYIPAP